MYLDLNPAAVLIYKTNTRRATKLDSVTHIGEVAWGSSHASCSISPLVGETASNRTSRLILCIALIGRCVARIAGRICWQINLVSLFNKIFASYSLLPCQTIGVGRPPPLWKGRLDRLCEGVPLVAFERVLIDGDVDASASRPSS